MTDRLMKKQCSAAGLSRARADFATQYRTIYASCRALESVGALQPTNLAREYMTLVLTTETDDGWWAENQRYLLEPWFIWDYACAHHLVQPQAAEFSPLSLRVLQPASPKYAGRALLHLERNPAHADQGRLDIHLTDAPPSIDALLRTQGFQPTEEGYFREIAEHAAPIVDRAVENAVLLLEEGCPVCIDEPPLEALILNRQFSPEHRHWVLATARPDRLQLLYPHDPRLHQYIYMAGGRWNGQAMFISISNAEKLEELMRLYGFRATSEAQHRLDVWHDAISQAVIYRQRGGKTRKQNAPEDVFKSMLEQSREVIEDLLETDE